MEAIGGEDPEAQYEFCCNIHIIRAVKIVAIIGLVLNPLWAAYMVISSPIIPYDFALVALCLYALILVAVHKENARLLIPYLIFNGIIIAARIIYCVTIVIVICSKTFWDHWRQYHPSSDPRVEKTEIIVHLVANFLKILLNIWFQHVVYRGYLYMSHRAETSPLITPGEQFVVTIQHVPMPNAEPPAYSVTGDGGGGGYQQSGVPIQNA